MKHYLLLLLAVGIGHSAQAQLLNKLKERAGSAVRSAMPAAGNSVADRAASRAEQATEKESIIFSKEPFKEGQTTGTATSFVPTDNIYARVLMPRTIYENLEARGKEDEPAVVMQVGLTADVQEGMQQITRYNYCYITVPKSAYKNKYFDLDVLPAANHLTTRYSGPADTKDHISSLFKAIGAEAPAPAIPFGKQRFRLEFGDGSGVVGYFTLTESNWKEKKPLDARISAIVNDQNAAEAKDTRLPAVFKAPGRFSDPQLSTASLKQKLGAETIRFAVEPGSVDYTIHKNALGVPEYKITRPIWTVEKGQDGNCYYTRYYLRREYEGGGKYGPLDFAATTASRVQIACENVK